MSNIESPQDKWYEANCHCAAVKYKFKLPPLETQEILSCNCSICSKNGYFNVYPKKSDVVFQSGEDKMKGYRFGEKKVMHKFCPTCGSSLLVDPHINDSDLLVVNVRMIKGIELDKLNYRYFDGKTKLSPQYDP
ncbi:hypothetical protein MMC28_000907 [Mycoblastus sanguinarius]|nr:hypothetical protein [Mycoblastus sanguinarius]